MTVPRFKILQRDGFRCRYCGATPHVSKLHVDHVQPKSKGGTDHHLNLVTACAACNCGKRDNEIDWEPCSPLVDVNGNTWSGEEQELPDSFCSNAVDIEMIRAIAESFEEPLPEQELCRCL